VNESIKVLVHRLYKYEIERIECREVILYSARMRAYSMRFRGFERRDVAFTHFGQT